MTDLEAASIEDVRDFYRTYYVPNNACVALVGDFETAEALALVEKFLGRVPKSVAVPRDIPKEPPQARERRTTVEESWPLPAVVVAYHITFSTGILLLIKIFQTNILGPTISSRSGLHPYIVIISDAVKNHFMFTQWTLAILNYFSPQFLKYEQGIKVIKKFTHYVAAPTQDALVYYFQELGRIIVVKLSLYNRTGYIQSSLRRVGIKKISCITWAHSGKALFLHDPGMNVLAIGTSHTVPYISSILFK